MLFRSPQVSLGNRPRRKFRSISSWIFWQNEKIPRRIAPPGAPLFRPIMGQKGCPALPPPWGRRQHGKPGGAVGGYFVCSLRERNPHRPPGGAPFKRGLFRLRTGVTPSFDRASDHLSDLPDSPVIPCIISRFASELTIWVHGCPVHSSDRLFLSDHNKLRPLSVYSRPLSDSPANAVIKFLASLHQHLRLFLTRQYRVL